MTTVALPVLGQHDIIWLQLESLCRQEHAGEWELIVSECETNYVNDLIFERYVERLYGRGCVTTRVINNPKRIPLGLKWRQIAQQAKGETMLLCAADNYSYPTRIAESAFAIASGFDFVDVDEGVFLNLNNGNHATWTRRNERTTGLFMAYRTELIRGLPDDPPDRNIDGWIRRQFPDMERVRLGARDGLHTDGSNTISRHRADLYDFDLTEPFVPSRQDWREILPGRVVSELDRMMRDKQNRVA